MHPTIERTYQLDDLNIPPKAYTDFLRQITLSFKEFILKENKVKSFQQLEKFAKGKIKRVDSGTSGEEVSRDLFTLPMSLSTKGELIFQKSSGEKVAGEIYRSNEYTQYFGDQPCLKDPSQQRYSPPSQELDQRYITITQSVISNGMREFRNTLDQAFPDRKNRLINPCFQPKSKKVQDHLSGFSFDLDLMSSPTNMLEAKVSLENGNCLMENRCFLILPRISVKANTTFGSMELPQRLVRHLESTVLDFYEPSSITHESKFTQSRKN